MLELHGCNKVIGGKRYPSWVDPCDAESRLDGCYRNVLGRLAPVLKEPIGMCDGERVGCHKIVGGKLAPILQFPEYATLQELIDNCCEESSSSSSLESSSSESSSSESSESSSSESSSSESSESSESSSSESSESSESSSSESSSSESSSSESSSSESSSSESSSSESSSSESSSSSSESSSSSSGSSSSSSSSSSRSSSSSIISWPVGVPCFNCNPTLTPKFIKVVVSGVTMVESDTCLPVGTKSYKISNIPDINGQYILEQWQFDSCDWRVSIPISTVYYTFSGSGCAFLANTISLTTLWIVVGVSGEFGTKFIWGSIRVGDWDEMGIHAFYNQRPQLDPCQFGTLTNEYTIVPQHSIISHGGIMTVEALL